MYLLLAASLASADESVTLHFAWPAGMTCAETAEDRASGVDGAVVMVRSTTRYATVPSVDGLRVAAVPEKVEVSVPGATGPRYDALLVGLLQERPDWVVGVDGQFVRVEDGERFRSGLASQVEALRANAPEAATPFFAPVQSVLVDAGTVEANVARAWDELVANWAGERFTVGRTERVETRMVSARWGGPSFAGRTEVRVEGWTRCAPEDEGTRCVRLEFATEPADPVAVAAMLADQARAANPGAEVEVKRVRLAQAGSLVVDPQTLVVYERRVDTYEDVRVTVDGRALSSTPFSRTVAASTRCEVGPVAQGAEAVAARW